MDNFFKGCPPKMSDGRLFTEHRASVYVDEHVKAMNGITRDDNYRMFLQENGEKIANKEWDYMKDNKSCFVNECVHNYPTRVNPPWFEEELNNYNQLANPNHQPKFVCKPLNDFRMVAKSK